MPGQSKGAGDQAQIPECDISCDIVSDIPGSRGTEIPPNARPPILCCRTSASCSATRRRRRTTARTHGSAKHISQEHCDPSRIEEASVKAASDGRGGGGT
jgi:hypothetical protein